MFQCVYRGVTIVCQHGVYLFQSLDGLSQAAETLTEACVYIDIERMGQ